MDLRLFYVTKYTSESGLILQLCWYRTLPWMFFWEFAYISSTANLSIYNICQYLLLQGDIVQIALHFISKFLFSIITTKKSETYSNIKEPWLLQWLKKRIYNRINQNICNHALRFSLSYYVEEETGAIKLLLTYIHFTISSIMKIYCYLF